MKKRHSALEDILNKELLKAAPDIGMLLEAIRKDHSLNVEESISVLRQIVHSLNTRFFPKITCLELILTDKCNLKCRYCYEKTSRSSSVMPEQMIEDALDLLVEYSGAKRSLTVHLLGGEPLMNWRGIEKTVAHCSAIHKTTGKKFLIEMTTNGTLIDDARAEYIGRNNIITSFSIDGGRTTHDRFRKTKSGKGTFGSAVKGLSRLKKFVPWIMAKVTVMPCNVPALRNDILELHELGINQFFIGPALGVPWPEGDMNAYMDQLMNLFEWYNTHTNGNILIDNFVAKVPEEPFFQCAGGTSKIAVSPSGVISLCSRMAAVSGERSPHSLGSVAYGLTNVGNRREFITGDKLKAACTKLGIDDRYYGGCWACNFTFSRDINLPDKQRFAFSEKETAFLRRTVRRDGL